MVESIIKSFDIWTDAQGVKSKGRVKSIENISLEGITHLRELILDLAIRGKLVPQDQSDEPASELLKKIEKEKEKLIKDGKIKKEKALSEIKKEEKLFALPKEWVMCKLGELGVTQTGATPSTNDSENFGDYIPFIGPGDLNDDKVCYNNNGLSKKGLEKGRLIEKNSILMVCIGGSIGKARIVDRDVSCNQQINTITCYRYILPNYVFTALSSPYFQQQILVNSRGSATPIINKGKWENIPVPLPPYAEQKRIVDKVQELMALCDVLEKEKTASLKTHQTLVAALLQTLTAAKDAGEVERAWHRLAPHFDTLFCTEDSIDQLKQTILQLAVMGRLAKQDPNDEPASVLLQNIMATKEKLTIEEGLKTNARGQIDIREYYIGKPDGWEYCRLGNLSKFIDYRGKTPNKINSGVRLITAKNVRFGYISLQPEEYISEAEYALRMTRGFPKNGDLLFTTEAPLGNVAVINLDEKFALAQRVICLQLHDQRINSFLRIAILSNIFQNLISEKATGMTATGIKSEKLKEIPVPIPPLSEQKRIVAKVDELTAICDKLQERLLKSQEIQNSLSKTIVESAVA